MYEYKGPYPLGNLCVVGDRNQPPPADSMIDSIVDHTVGMAYLLGDWVTNKRATRIAGRLDDRQFISSMFDNSSRTHCPAAVAQ